MLKSLTRGNSKSQKKSFEIDMCSGPIFSKIIKFSVPLILSSILQLLFHAADVIVVGNFSGHTALAAVGATGAVTNLIINVFMGLSVGVNVLCARYFGAGDKKNLSETVHTTVAISVLFGIILTFVGFFLSEHLLLLMGTPADVIEQATLYIRIIFLGMPAILFYNFGSAILRAVGDTKRPLYFLTIAGILNVLVNLLLVIVFDMGVAGVAIATIISQLVSAILVLLCLVKSESIYAVKLKQIKIYKKKFIEIVKIGLPAGLQGAVFALSHTVIQSTVNSFGSNAIAGNTAASSLENFIYVSLNAFHQAGITFISQNIGAGKYSRINKIASQCILSAAVLGFTMGVLMLTFGESLIGIYNSDPNVIVFSMERLKFLPFYFLCGVMDVLIGLLRGMRYSVLPMVISLVGACGLRILWIYTLFPVFGQFDSIFVIFPISWGITALASGILYIYARRKLPKIDQPVLN